MLNTVNNFRATPGTDFGSYLLQWDYPQDGRHFGGIQLYRSYYDPYNHFVKISETPITLDVATDFAVAKLFTEQPLSVSVSRPGFVDVDHHLIMKVSKPPIRNFLYSFNSFDFAPTDEIRNRYSISKSFKDSVFIRVKYDNQFNAFVSRIHGNFLDVEDHGFFASEAPLPLQSIIPNYDPQDLSRWTVEYYATDYSATPSMLRNVWYKAVLLDVDMKPLHSLESAPLATPELQDKVSYLWQEALRRNQWLIGFGGESVLVYLRRWTGRPCKCKSTGEVRCERCYGTGLEDGYVGPYSLRILVEDVQSDMSLTSSGIKTTITTRATHIPCPFPLHKGDIIIRANGDRLTLGTPTSTPVNGIVLQQSMDLSQATPFKNELPNPNADSIYIYQPQHKFLEPVPVPLDSFRSSTDPLSFSPDKSTESDLIPPSEIAAKHSQPLTPETSDAFPSSSDYQLSLQQFGKTSTNKST